MISTPKDTSYLIVQQADRPESVLPFPSESIDRVASLLKESYPGRKPVS